MIDSDTKICSHRCRFVTLRYLAFFLCLLTCVNLGARAAIVQGLYQAATRVSNQSSAARTRAFARDLSTVLVKVSGNKGAPQMAALSKMLADPQSLLVEYRYQTRKVHQGHQVLQLWARFDPKAVNQALSAAGQPIWEAERPIVIAWVHEPGKIISDSSNGPVAKALKRVARARGVPLILPLMDLTDRQSVNGFDIRTVAMSALTKASERYGAQAILTGRIEQKSHGYLSQWTLVLGKNNQSWQIPGKTLRSVATKGLNHAVTWMAQQYASASGAGGQQQVTLNLDGIKGLRALAHVRHLLDGFRIIQSLQVTQVHGQEAAFELTLNGSVSQLKQTLNLSDAFHSRRAPVAKKVPAEQSELSAARIRNLSLNTLYYRYYP